jgi:hypothetical protein
MHVASPANFPILFTFHYTGLTEFKRKKTKRRVKKGKMNKEDTDME